MPNYSKKEPRALRPNQILNQWHNLEQSNRQIRQVVVKETQALITDPEKFLEQIIGFKPYEYQKELIEMFQNNQFTAARWCRQSGKTFIITAMLLWYATTHPKTAIAIVGPSWRQTKRILQRIAAFTHNLPPNIVFKPQKTQIHFTNGSTIEAFPNNPDTIRGPTFNIVYCLPAGVKVTLADGNQVPIEQIKPGQSVLSYNLKIGKIEPKHVLRTFRNPKAGRKIIRINHEHGMFDCTAEHKIYTSTRGFVNSSELCQTDKILYLAIKQTRQCNVTGACNLQRDNGESFVYDMEVEDNHSFFADGVLVSNCDEMNFIANDQELYDAILYTLGTTDGKFVCSSTPWHTDSIFFKIFNHKDFQDFKTSHVTYERAMHPNGPLKPGIIQKIRTQMGDDQARWRREMEAEWVEDDNVWLPQSLIASCIGTTKSCGQELQEYSHEAEIRGEFFCGLDLAQTKDYTVFSVIERQNDKLFLRHLKIFQQPTLYAQVLGYIKNLQDRWNGFEKIRVDFTREGPSIIADMQNSGIDNAEGVTFSVPRKSEMASLLKQRMMNKQIFYPLMSWERPYRGEICTELNVERYSLRKDGQIGYAHPTGTHDDVFWSIALSVFATIDMQPEPYLAVIPR